MSTEKSTKHYHVLNGMHGYLPDNNEVYRTKQSAQWGIHDLVGIFRENGDRFRGSAREGYYEQITGNYYLEITECFEEECLRELED